MPIAYASAEGGTGQADTWPQIGMTVIAGGRGLGSYCYNVTDTSAYLAVRATAKGVLTNIVRFECAMFRPTGDEIQIRIVNGGADQAHLHIQADGTVRVTRGNLTTVVGTTAAGVIPADTWITLHMEILISNTGSWKLYQDGDFAIPIFTGTGNTRATGSAPAQFVGFGGYANVLYDDIVILDETEPWTGCPQWKSSQPEADQSLSGWTVTTGPAAFQDLAQWPVDDAKMVTSNGVTGSECILDFPPSGVNAISMVRFVAKGTHGGPEAGTAEFAVRTNANTVPTGALPVRAHNDYSEHIFNLDGLSNGWEVVSFDASAFGVIQI